MYLRIQATCVYLALSPVGKYKHKILSAGKHHIAIDPSSLQHFTSLWSVFSRAFHSNISFCEILEHAQTNTAWLWVLLFVLFLQKYYGLKTKVVSFPLTALNLSNSSYTISYLWLDKKYQWLQWYSLCIPIVFILQLRPRKFLLVVTSCFNLQKIWFL